MFRSLAPPPIPRLLLAPRRPPPPKNTTHDAGTAGSTGAGGATPDSGACLSDRGTWDDPPAALAADAGTFRTSLQQCWTDAACPRVMLVAHGGDWDGYFPYDSRGAF